ncbi:hypothetical protein [Sulfurospirillum sp. hDNRA2]|uniref:hypothetical protein n=1 Tax=Sulfurospirillum sp. hDNRA2 TaxID=3237298 RepID=UPI0020B7101D|nr:hypothetical protein [Sulfurospirillum sp. DNRA8]MCP3650870.1 hypothetical protein [Sulfurospirillum sp. DNRA8]MCR1809716.1 hypothetical protein [Sulfurospirillum sp. DNRA8]
MAVNRYRKHLVVFLEDKPYRSILNGVKILPNVNYNFIDVKNPCGGWLKVFEEFKKNLSLLHKYSECHILLLIDFDDEVGSLSNFQSRKDMLQRLIPLGCADRVFLLGVNHEESEALKDFFGMSDFEDIGKKLVEDCPHGNLSHWKNTHLECNLPEIERMRENGVFGWLFC